MATGFSPTRLSMVYETPLSIGASSVEAPHYFRFIKSQFVFSPFKHYFPLYYPFFKSIFKSNHMLAYYGEIGLVLCD